MRPSRREPRATSRDVCAPVVEVGPGYTGLQCVDEDPPGRGPLAALVVGAATVPGAGPVLLLACDLPFVTEALLRRLASWDGDGTVVPVDRDGFVQPVCARYSRTRRSAGPGASWPTASGRSDPCCRTRT